MTAPDLTVATILVAFAGVFLICFMKGAFGGGFSIVGIPLLSIVMDPVTAGGLLAPLFIAMDLFALRYWKPSTWSKPDLVLLLPGLLIGIGLGYLLFRVMDHRAIAIVMAATTLIFVGLWFAGGGEVTIRPRRDRDRRREATVEKARRLLGSLKSYLMAREDNGKAAAPAETVASV